MKVFQIYAVAISFVLFVSINLSADESLVGPDYLESREQIEMEIDMTPYPSFPYALELSGYTNGKVSVVVEVDQFGELRDYLTIEYTHEGFARAVERVIPKWGFSPPKINGEPVPIIRRFDFSFEAKGNLVSFDLLSGNDLFFNSNNGEKMKLEMSLTSPYDLDEFPELIEYKHPLMPQELIEKCTGDTAVFRFYIDQDGNARIPALSKVNGQIDLRLLYEMQEAITQWKFTPPRKNGKPTIIYVAQPISMKEAQKLAKQQ